MSSNESDHDEEENKQLIDNGNRIIVADDSDSESNENINKQIKKKKTTKSKTKTKSKSKSKSLYYKINRSSHSEQFKSCSFFINFLVLIIIGFGIPLNDLTENECGWNQKRVQFNMVPFDELCNVYNNNGYCIAQTIGLIWLILNILSFTINLISCFVNYFDKIYGAFCNLISGILLLCAGIIFQFGQNVCNESIGPSLVIDYGSAFLLLTCGFWVFPVGINIICCG